MLKLKLKAPEPEPEPEREEMPKISLNLSTPKIKVKTKAAVEGYDSEAPDKEDDPTVEEAVVLRMLPGAGLEKLQKMCEANSYDNLSIKFEDQRRAVLDVDGGLYACQLVDLPTVTEVQKTFDRKNIYKSVDIAQMLLVVKEIKSESELQSAIPTTQQYQHGIAPPLHNVRNRRFQQRVSNKLVEVIETKVDELFKKDLAAQDVQYELLPASAIEQTPGVIVSDILDVQAPGDDEEDEEDDFDMAMELEKALEEDKDEEDDDDDEDSEDDDDDEDVDPTDARNHNKLLKEEIHELQVTINAKERESEATVNQIMKGRLIDVVNRMKSELQMKSNMLKDAEEAEQQDQENAQEQEEEEPDEDDETKEEPAVEQEAENKEPPVSSNAAFPALDEPAPEDPAAEDPATEDPATEDPATEDPASGEPTPAAVDGTMDDDLDALF